MQISRKNLLNVIKETYASKKSIDSIILESLLLEFNITKLANRALGQDKKILIEYLAGAIVIAVFDSKKLVYNNTRKEMPLVLAGCELKHEHNIGYRLITLYGKDPSSTILCLATAIAAAEAVICDLSVSPAASTVIKSYYDKFKDDPNLIEKDGDPARVRGNLDENRPWLRAKYKTFPELNNIMAHKKDGEAFLEEFAAVRGLEDSKLIDLMLSQYARSFSEHYDDPQKTRFEQYTKKQAEQLIDAIDAKDISGVISTLNFDFKNLNLNKQPWQLTLLKDYEQLILKLYYSVHVKKEDLLKLDELVKNFFYHYKGIKTSAYEMAIEESDHNFSRATPVERMYMRVLLKAEQNIERNIQILKDKINSTKANEDFKIFYSVYKDRVDAAIS